MPKGVRPFLQEVRHRKSRLYTVFLRVVGLPRSGRPVLFAERAKQRRRG